MTILERKANYKRQPLLVNEYIVEYNATLALNDIERSIIRKELTLAFKKRSQTQSNGKTYHSITT